MVRLRVFLIDISNAGLRRVSTADRLLGLRVRIPPRAWMFMLCVLYNKDKMHSQDNQDKVLVQMKYREQKSYRGHGCLSVVSVVCCQVEVSATG